MFLEETDWCWKIREAGWRVVHLPDVELVHLSGASSGSKDALKKRIEYHRSLYRFLGKRRGGAVVWIVGLSALGRRRSASSCWHRSACISERQRRRWRERAVCFLASSRLSGRRGARARGERRVALMTPPARPPASRAHP